MFQLQVYSTCQGGGDLVQFEMYSVAFETHAWTVFVKRAPAIPDQPAAGMKNSCFSRQLGEHGWDLLEASVRE